MIVTFEHKGLQRFFRTGSTRGIQAMHAPKLIRILQMLDATTNPQGMDLPGFKLHPLKGKLRSLWAVSVSGNWRVTFRFTHSGNAELVDYQDYH